MDDELPDAVIRILNAGADPDDVQILLDEAEGVQFVITEDLQQSQTVH